MAVSKKPREVTRSAFGEARCQLTMHRGMQQIMALLGRGLAVQHVANVRALGTKVVARG